MGFLIDGYNLLYVAGILARGVGPGSLERSRLALLNFLAESLTPKELATTTVIFDASQALPGLPRQFIYRGIQVRFAAEYPDADTLIEELVQSESAPRRLTVVSSDHRLQRAARRRRAKAVDADRWYAALVRRRATQKEKAASDAAEKKPPVPLPQDDVDYWVDRFGGEEAFEKLFQEELGPPPSRPESKSSSKSAPESAKKSPPERGDPFPEEDEKSAYWSDESGNPINPFPPGYGEDLEEEM